MQSSLAAGLSHSAAKQVSIWLGFSAGAPLALLFCCLLVRRLLFAAQQRHPLLQTKRGSSYFSSLDVLSPSAGRLAPAGLELLKGAHDSCAARGIDLRADCRTMCTSLVAVQCKWPT